MRVHSISTMCALAVAFIAGSHPLQAADITYTEVDLLHQLSFDAPYFTNASWYNTLTLTVAPGSSGSQDFHFDLYPDNQGLTFFATGGVSVDQTSAPAGTASVTLHVTATGAGTFGVHELAPPYYSPGGLDPNSFDPLQVYTSGNTGRQVLLFQAPSASNLNIQAGVTWMTTVTMPGDWSQAGSGDIYGVHLLAYYDPLWTLTSDFVYNPAANQTVLSVVNHNYPGAGSGDDDGPYPTFYLAGQATPEPSQISLLSLGLLTFGGLLLRKRYASRTNAHSGTAGNKKTLAT